MLAGSRFSDDAVHQFHARLDSEAYDDILRNSNEAFQGTDSPEELLKFLGAVHSKLGRSIACTRNGIYVNVGTHGTFITSHYTTSFEHGLAAESFVWRKADGGLQLAGYNVQSKAFLAQ